MIRRNECGRICAALGVVIAVTVVGTEMAGSSTVGPSPATGVIVTVPGTNLGDGETFRIDDGAGGTTTFEFDSDGSVTPGNSAVSFDLSDGVGTVAATIRAAVNAAPLQVTASSTTGAAVWLTNDNTGPEGNVAIAETVSDADFAVLGMSGGSDTTTTVGPSAATGLIVTVPGTNLGDGETFRIDDGAGGTTTFEFDSDGSVTPGNSAVSFDLSDGVGTVAATIRAAVNAAPLQVTASSTTGAAVWLTNDNTGPEGNVAITETVSDADFAVLGMSGGTNDDNAPSAGTVHDGLSLDVDRQGDASVLEANWSGFTDDVGVDHYEYSASTSGTCDGDVLSATNVGTATSYTVAASLTAGTTYYSCVRAYDAAGNPSAWVASDGVSLASGTLTVTSAVKNKGTTSVTFTDSANTAWIVPAGVSTPFECNLGSRGAWVRCASGDTFKSSAKSVTVRGYLDVTPPLLVQSAPYTPTR